MSEQQDSTTYWIRNYKCNNPFCCDGIIPIQVCHTTDTKEHECVWCGEMCEYVSDEKVVTA